MTYHEKSNADTHPQQNEVISSWMKHKSTKTAHNHAKENKKHKFLQQVLGTLQSDELMAVKTRHKKSEFTFLQS